MCLQTACVLYRQVLQELWCKAYLVAKRLVSVVPSYVGQVFKKRYYYMAVTNDKYELPLSPPLSQQELARFLGVHYSTISHYCRDRVPVLAKRKFIRLLAAEIDN